MSQLVLELPASLNYQVKSSGLTQKQLGDILTYLLEMYFKINQDQGAIRVLSNTEREKKPRKAGSAKHMGIKIADDFDEPLEEFEEYM
ncbi:MAG: DUF2281 domain-containing protein [Chloroflexota bacterium]